MNNENSMDSLKNEIQRITESLTKSEMNLDKKRIKLTAQLVALEKAVEILKNKA